MPHKPKVVRSATAARASMLVCTGLVQKIQAPDAEVWWQALAVHQYSETPEPVARVAQQHERVTETHPAFRLPRIEMKELGPSFQLTLDRTRLRWYGSDATAAHRTVHSALHAREPDKDRWKQAIKVPKAAKPKKAMLEQVQLQAAKCRKEFRGHGRGSFPLAWKH